MTFRTIAVTQEGRIATIQLNRPDRLNAIAASMPGEIRRAVEALNEDPGVHVIIVEGAGRAFCAGYDLKDFAETPGAAALTQAMPWDPTQDFRVMRRFTEDYSALTKSHAPTIAKVHGYAVAGGSDIALSCDLLLMADDAKIGYPPARLWGCPTTAHWAYRVGVQQAKRLLFTGELIDGTEAARIGLALEAVPPADLDARVHALASQIASVPRSQLLMQKLVLNAAAEGLAPSHAQTLATLLDGITRHSPEGLWFKAMSESQGFHAAVARRDSGEPLPNAPIGGGPIPDGS